MKARVDKLRPGRDMDALVAARVMGWKEVKPAGKSGGVMDYRGKRRDNAGRFRVARVPPYSTDHAAAAAIEPRMKELRIFERYLNELSKITHARGLPTEWAAPDQLCRAALNVVGQPRLSRVK